MLTQTLFELRDRRDRFDAVVIEATGRALAGPIARTLLREPDLQDAYVGNVNRGILYRRLRAVH